MQIGFSPSLLSLSLTDLVGPRKFGDCACDDGLPKPGDEADGSAAAAKAEAAERIAEEEIKTEDEDYDFRKSVYDRLVPREKKEDDDQVAGPETRSVPQYQPASATAGGSPEGVSSQSNTGGAQASEVYQEGAGYEYITVMELRDAEPPSPTGRY